MDDEMSAAIRANPCPDCGKTGHFGGFCPHLKEIPSMLDKPDHFVEGIMERREDTNPDAKIVLKHLLSAEPDKSCQETQRLKKISTSVYRVKKSMRLGSKDDTIYMIQKSDGSKELIFYSGDYGYHLKQDGEVLQKSDNLTFNDDGLNAAINLAQGMHHSNFNAVDRLLFNLLFKTDR